MSAIFALLITLSFTMVLFCHSFYSMTRAMVQENPDLQNKASKRERSERYQTAFKA